MTRIRIGLAVAVAALVACVGYAAAAPEASKLDGFVNDSFKIGLTQNGKAVKTLKAGKYTFVIKDTTTAHNFHLTGPGLNKTTSVSGKATATWTLTLKKGSYKFVCDPHASFMKGSFNVK
jgi:plastocyanin